MDYLTKLQIALIMLLVGSDKQKVEAVEFLASALRK